MLHARELLGVAGAGLPTGAAEGSNPGPKLEWTLCPQQWTLCPLYPALRAGHAYPHRPPCRPSFSSLQKFGQPSKPVLILGHS